MIFRGGIRALLARAKREGKFLVITPILLVLFRVRELRARIFYTRPTLYSAILMRAFGQSLCTQVLSV